MPSLRELQQDFLATLFAGDGAAPPFATIPEDRAVERVAVYRRALFTNYRNALGASYPVVKRLVGAPFFHAAVDAFVGRHPATSGDLNLYGDAFGVFLGAYPPAADLPYLGDVAALEWAQDEANRSAEDGSSPEAVLAALSATAPVRWPTFVLALAPSCRLVSSRYPILRIWQVNQDFSGDQRVSLDGGPDRLLVRREAQGVTIERITEGEHAWLAALMAGSSLGDATDAAQGADATFDLRTVLCARISDRTIADVRTA